MVTIVLTEDKDIFSELSIETTVYFETNYPQLVYSIQAYSEPQGCQNADIIFIDLSGDRVTAIQKAAQLRKLYPYSEIVFLDTGSENLIDILNGDIRPTAVLLKPINAERLCNLLDNIVRDRLLNRRIKVYSGYKLHLIEPSTIYYLEKSNRKTVIKTSNYSLEASVPMANISAQLDYRFVKTDRGIIANLAKINNVDFANNTITLINGELLQLARNRKKLLKEKLEKANQLYIR